MSYGVIVTMDMRGRRRYPHFATYIAFHDGQKYRLPVLKFLMQACRQDDVLPNIDKHAPFLFQTKCWWIGPGPAWFIGNSLGLSEGGPDTQEMHGPFNDVDECIVYLKLVGEQR